MKLGFQVKAELEDNGNKAEHAEITVCFGEAGLPKSKGNPGEDNGCEDKTMWQGARVCAAGLGSPNPRGNPGEDNGCEEKPCGKERVCAARLGSPNPRGNPGEDHGCEGKPMWQ